MLIPIAALAFARTHLRVREFPQNPAMRERFSNASQESYITPLTW